MRITRRDFLKYCATAAGALGLTSTDLMKLEKALATPVSMGGTQVVWLNGAACTGCTVSLANSAYYAKIQDLLVPWVPAAAAIGVPPSTLVSLGLTDTGTNGPLDLVFMETLSSAVGSAAINAAKTVLATNGGTAPFVLCIEGAIQTNSDGNFCRIGNGANPSDTATIAFMDEVQEFALDANCLAILAVGTCASFGGIPAAKGSVTGAKGLISTGSISGGYAKVNNQGLWDYLKATNSGTSRISKITVTNGGSGYTVAPTVTFSAGITDATAVASLNTAGVIQYITVTSGGEYTSTPSVIITPALGGAAATAVMKANQIITAAEWTTLMGKTVCVSGCPPHPDWIVGTIVYLLTYGEPPLTDKFHRPVDFYQEYQCTNCLWQTNQPGTSNVNPGSNPMKNIDGTLLSTTTQGGVTVGNSPRLFKWKYDASTEGCLGVMGCKGRKTKADCSFRRWNSDTLGQGGVSWCVQTRAGCHGCTEPRFPDGWGKFFSFK